MKKKNFTREVKVGIMVVVAIFVLYFGLNFLKGIDIFSPISYYYATYTNVDGLEKSAPVFVKGYKVGQVDEIKYDFSKDIPFVVKISVKNDIQLPKDAKMELFDNGLMGGKAIQLVFDPTKTGESMYASGDTVVSLVSGGIMAQLSGELMPKIESITTQTDSLIRSVRTLVDSKELNNSLSSIEKTTADLSASSAQLKKLMSNDVPKIMSNVNAMTGDLKQVSGNLKKVDFESTFNSINHTINNLSLITDKINSPKGTLGMLLNDKDLYINLSNTAASTDKLLIDLKENPKRYVHFSLFGSKTK